MRRSEYQDFELHNIEPAIIEHDISVFLSHKLELIGQKFRLEGAWKHKRTIAVLVQNSGGLFIWASTAVKLVSTSDNPFAKLKELVSDSRSPSEFGLYQLYAAVLRSSGIEWEKETSRSRFCAVMGLLAACRASDAMRTVVA